MLLTSLLGRLLSLLGRLLTLLGRSSGGRLLGLTRRLSCLIGGLPCGFLPLLGGLSCLIGCLARSVLGLLGRSSGGLLRLARYLACLIGGLPRDFLSLPGRLPCGVLRALGNLTHLICDPAQGTSASLAFTLLLTSAGETAHGVLDLARCLACLVGGLPGYLLGLACCLSGGILRLLGRFLRELLHLLHGLLGSLVHRFLDTRILGRLIHGALELHVGVDHLLDLSLLVAFGELLSVLLQLFAVILSLALDPTQRLPVEVLGVLHGLLLHLLL